MCGKREENRKRGDEDMIVLKKDLQRFKHGFHSSVKDVYLYFGILLPEV